LNATRIVGRDMQSVIEGVEVLPSTIVVIKAPFNDLASHVMYVNTVNVF
jgi:hypothetical protein